MSGNLRIASPAEFAVRCTPLHAEALFRVASGRSMFEVASCYHCVRNEAATVAADLRRWMLVTGKGDDIQLTRFGHRVMHALQQKGIAMTTAAYKRHMLHEKERRDEATKAKALEAWARDALKWMIAMQLDKGITIAGAILDGSRPWPEGQRVPELIQQGLDALGLQVRETTPPASSESASRK